MTQLRLGHQPEPDRPYVPLHIKPNPALIAQGDYIKQAIVRICAYCQIPLQVEEKLGNLTFVNVINETQEHHNETCARYEASRVTLDDADGHLPTGPDVRAVAPRPRKKAA